MNKKITAIVLAAVLTLSAAALSGCNNLSEDEENKTHFNLGHLNSTAHLLGFVAKEEGYFSEEGLDVTLNLTLTSLNKRQKFRICKAV